MPVWYLRSRTYLERTNDQTFLRDIYPTLKEIIDWHRRGTRYSIHVDPADGLLYAGRIRRPTHVDGCENRNLGRHATCWKARGDQRTLALRAARMAEWAQTLKDRPAVTDYREAAKRVAATFSDTFWFEEAATYTTSWTARMIPRTLADVGSIRASGRIRYSVSRVRLVGPAAGARSGRHLLPGVADSGRSAKPLRTRFALRRVYSGGPAARDALITKALSGVGCWGPSCSLLPGVTAILNTPTPCSRALPDISTMPASAPSVKSRWRRASPASRCFGSSRGVCPKHSGPGIY